MLTSIKKEYEEKGVAVIPNVFTPEECDEIKRQAYSVTDEQISAGGYPHGPSETAYNKKSLIFFPSVANEYINNIRIDERMADIVRFFIGDDVKQINNQIYFREAGDQDTFAWHRDTIFREGHIFDSNLATDYLQTIIAVDAITDDNSPVEFIEGSQHWESFPKPHNLRHFIRGEYKGTKYKANKGDVSIWSVRIVHGSERNTSSTSRMTYMNGFCRSRCASTYPDYMIDGKVIPKLNARLIP